MDCNTLIKYLSDYIDNDLDEELTAAAREHLATCPNCRVVLDSTQQMLLLYQDQQHKRVIPASRRKKLYNQIAAIFDEK